MKFKKIFSETIEPNKLLYFKPESAQIWSYKQWWAF